MGDHQRSDVSRPLCTMRRPPAQKLKRPFAFRLRGDHGYSVREGPVQEGAHRGPTLADLKMPGDLEVPGCRTEWKPSRVVDNSQP